MRWPLQCCAAGSQVGLPWHKCGWEAAHHLAAVHRGLEEGRMPGAGHTYILSVLHQKHRQQADAVSPCVMLTNSTSSWFTLETNFYLQACQQAEYIRKQLQAPDKSSSLQTRQDSRGGELSDTQLLQTKSAVQRREGGCSDHEPSKICACCFLSPFPCHVHRQKQCKTPGGR